MKEPEKVKELVGDWEEYVKKNNVIIPDLMVLDDLERRLPERIGVDDAFPPLKFQKPFVPPPDLVKTYPEKMHKHEGENQ